ncbi:hypothetical protein Tco_0700133, partial [Tanacetum coccineum]
FLLKSEKLVAVTPMNKARKVTFAKITATSENNTQTRVNLHKTQTTNKPLVPSTSVQSSTNASGSIPRSTTKNTRIMQPLSSNQKYQRVEAHTRNAKSSLDKGNSMSKSVCSTCKKCLFDANHDLCVVNYLSDVNACARAKSVKSVKKNVWKPTGLLQNLVSSTPYVPPSKKDYDIMCQPLFEEHFQPPSSVVSLMFLAAEQLYVDTTSTSLSTTIVQDVPSISTSPIT